MRKTSKAIKSDFTQCLLPNHTQVCANGGLHMITMYVSREAGKRNIWLRIGRECFISGIYFKVKSLDRLRKHNKLKVIQHLGIYPIAIPGLCTDTCSKCSWSKNGKNINVQQHRYFK